MYENMNEPRSEGAISVFISVYFNDYFSQQGIHLSLYES